MRGVLVVLLCSCGRIDFDARDAATDDGTGSATSFCATQPPATFCSDFDVAPDFGDWSGRGEMGARVSLAPNGLSPPSMLDVISDPLATSADTCAGYVFRTLAVSATHATIGFDVRIVTLGQGDPVFATLNLDDGTLLHGFEFVYRVPPLLAYLEERRGATSPLYDSYPVSMPLPSSEWHRVTMDITVGTMPSTAEVRYDQQVVLTTPLMGTTGGTVAQFAAGVEFLRGPSSAWQVDIDNVVVDLQ